MSNLTDGILALVKANLPEATAGMLAEHLKTCEKTAQDHARLKERYSEQEQKLTELQSLRNDADSNKNKQAELAEREANLIRAEFEMATQQTLVECRINEAEKRADQIHDLAATVFRNPRFTTSTSVHREEDIVRDGFTSGQRHIRESIDGTAEER